MVQSFGIHDQLVKELLVTLIALHNILCITVDISNKNTKHHKRRNITTYSYVK